MRDAIALVWAAGRREIGLALVLQVLIGVALAAQILLARTVVAAVFAKHHSTTGFDNALPAVLFLLASAAVVNVGSVVIAERGRVLAELTRRYLQDRILQIATTVELEAYDTPGFYNRLQRAQLGAQTRPTLLVGGLLGVISGVVGIAGLAAALTIIHPLLLLLLLVGYVPVLLASGHNSRLLYRFEAQRTPAERRLSYFAFFATDRYHAKEVRALGLGPYLRRNHADLHGERIAKLRELVEHRLQLSVVAVILPLLVLALAVFGLLATGDLTIADAGSAAWGVLLLGSRLQSSSTGAANVYESALFLEDVAELLAIETTDKASRSSVGVFRTIETLSAENIWFTYPGAAEPTLRGVSLGLARGEMVALVGESGAGKSTLVKILCGLYKPSRGRILWDGVDVGSLESVAWRKAVAVIFQDFMRYEFSARENIGLGDHERLDDLPAIVEAARKAGAGEFLSALPRGYETLLSCQFGKGGVDLSIGQWQRVAIARALFRGSPLVVFDEPTSALDPRAEREVFEVVKRLCQERAILIISHRFSTVRAADRICVLADGTIVEEGSHDALMAASGQYAELFTMQAAAYRA